MMGHMSLSVMASRYGGILMNNDADLLALSIDSRNLRPGQSFIAIHGPNFDGHDFAAEAVEKGVSSLVVERPIKTLNVPQWIVEDSIHALGEIGKSCRESFKAPIVGITGSSGKTSVKEMLASILRQRGEVLSTKGNYNNHLGVPLMLAELQPNHAFAVLEMGASAIGEIAYLADLVQPDVALVNNIGSAHLEGFGSRENIVQGKGEIYQALSDAGRAVVNLDSFGADTFLQQISVQTLTFSASGNPAADVRVSNVRLHDAGSNYVLHTPLGDVEIQQNLLGLNNVSNGAAAATCALSVGMRLDEIRAGLDHVGQVSGRLFKRRGVSGSRILDDAYNANPESMSGAIDVLTNFSGTRVFVMGAMGELGPDSEVFHRQMGERARLAGIEVFICVGEPTKAAAEAFGDDAIWMETNAEAAEYCLNLLGPDVTVLIKGSRSARLEEVVNVITDLGRAKDAVLAN